MTEKPWPEIRDFARAQLVAEWSKGTVPRLVHGPTFNEAYKRGREQGWDEHVHTSKVKILALEAKLKLAEEGLDLVRLGAAYALEENISADREETIMYMARIARECLEKIRSGNNGN